MDASLSAARWLSGLRSQRGTRPRSRWIRLKKRSTRLRWRQTRELKLKASLRITRGGMQAQTPRKAAPSRIGLVSLARSAIGGRAGGRIGDQLGSHRRAARLAPRLMRQQRRDDRPFPAAQFMTAHRNVLVSEVESNPRREGIPVLGDGPWTGALPLDPAPAPKRRVKRAPMARSRPRRAATGPPADPFPDGGRRRGSETAPPGARPDRAAGGTGTPGGRAVAALPSPSPARPSRGARRRPAADSTAPGPRAFPGRTAPPPCRPRAGPGCGPPT